MYIWTKDGLGQSQPTRFTLQTFNPPAAQPAPIGYLGNFNEHIGKGASGHCEDIQVVDQFDPGSAQLKDFHKKHITDIAIRFLRLINRDVGPIRKQKVEVSVDLYVEGHVDKQTDPQPYGTLDMERAAAVFQELSAQMSKLRLGIGNLRLVKFNPPTNSYSKPGSTRPTGVTRRGVSQAALNRRVVICPTWVIIRE
jgi:hypothetical protein